MPGDVVEIVMTERLPAGLLGPDPVTLDVRAFLVPHATGLVPVDTGLDPSGRALDAALSGAGAAWTDVSDVVLTHAHPDHTGALAHVRTAAPTARVLADPREGLDVAALADGDTVGDLRAVATPGHTPGHTSLVDESRGVLLVGDCVGVVDGRLQRAPAPFTADADLAERSLHRLLGLRGLRLLLAHGPAPDDPWTALDALLATPPTGGQG